MNNKRATKRALLTSVTALVMCVVMLVGTTFAWFTDTASTGVNKIQAGNLDIEVEYAKEEMDATGKLTGNLTEFKTIEKSTEVFDGNALWEPGRTEYVVFKITNNGNLALKYRFSLDVRGQKAGVNKAGDPYELADFLLASAQIDERSGVIGSGYSTITDWMTKANDLGMAGTNYFNRTGKTLDDITLEGTLEAGKVNCVALAVWMPEDVGNEANAISIEKCASIDLGITVVATQYTVESDSFGTDYDEKATYPVVSATGLKDALAEGGSLVLSSDVNIAPEIADKTANTLVPQMTVSKDTVLDLSDKEIGVDASDDFGNASPVLMAVTGGTLTLNGEGTINCEAGEQQVYGINVNGGKVVINGGEYYGAITAVQVQKGSLVINGGFFDMAPTCKGQVPQYAKYIVNCIDANYKNGTATISITGGTFVNFDPSNNPEGAGTSYVADGYKVTSETQSNGDVWYTVVKA